METTQRSSNKETRPIRVRYQEQYYDIGKFAPRHPGEKRRSCTREMA